MMRRILITGGAGFIGVNAAHHFSRAGWNVSIVDNFSRKGARANGEWLSKNASVTVYEVDVRDQNALGDVIKGLRPVAILHLAGQVAVTTSIVDPRTDFEINALGTFNLLEGVRQHCAEAVVLYASTNKVYGGMTDVKVRERNGRYQYEELEAGIPESHQLDFHSPYGCSKGAADQYVLDYARIFGIRTASFRQSCIYGPHQFGVEDQGWVAWFTIAAHLRRPITIYGDGKQVRDVLFVEDLLQAYERAFAVPDVVAGTAYNIGGGPGNTLSLLELITQLEAEIKSPIPLKFEDWRAGDQKVFVCDVSKARKELGWAPKVSAAAGVSKLSAWVQEHRELLSAQLV